MSRNTRTSLVAALLVAVISVPALAQAQRRGRPAPRPVVISPFYSPFYAFYNPFFFDFYGWDFPGPGRYGPGPAGDRRGFMGDSSARIQVTPRETEVYVDGYRAGIVDDFDGSLQRLRVSPGAHEIELYLGGHKAIADTINFQPGKTYRIKHTMEKLAAGEAESPRPVAKTPPPETRSIDAFGQPIERRDRGRSSDTQGSRGSATIAIRVQPGDAAILVDGERWQGSGGDRLEIQVTPGEHRIEAQKDGYQPFSTTVRVRGGESAPINISLSKSGDN